MAKRNSGKDYTKATLTLWLSVMGVIILATLLVLYTKKIPTVLVLGLVLLLEFFYAVPSFNFAFYKLHGADLEGTEKITSFIPFIGYIKTFAEGFAWTMIVYMILFLPLAVSTAFPQIYSFLGDSFILTFDRNFPVYVVLAFILYNILIGIGLYHRCAQVNKLYNYAFKNEQINTGLRVVHSVVRAIPYLDAVLCAIPVLRCIPLLDTVEKASALTKAGIYFYNQDEF